MHSSLAKQLLSIIIKLLLLFCSYIVKYEKVQLHHNYIKAWDSDLEGINVTDLNTITFSKYSIQYSE